MLTPSHHELLAFLSDYIERHGYSPSYAEMAEAVGLKSKSSINRLMNCLVERGYVRRLPHKARAIEINKGCRDLDRPTVDRMVHSLRECREAVVKLAAGRDDARYWTGIVERADNALALVEGAAGG